MLVFVSFCGISDGHTIEDLIFVWKYDNPLSIKENLELPEFGIAGTGVGDCTRVFSTGIIPIRCSVSLFVVSLPLSFVLCSSPLTEIQRHFQLSSRVSSPLEASSRRSSPPAHRRHPSAIWSKQTCHLVAALFSTINHLQVSLISISVHYTNRWLYY